MSNRSITPISTPQLFLNEEDKTTEALSTFTELQQCTYASKQLGNSQNEFMECDCYENLMTDENGNRVNVSCGEDSDCINRLTLIECVNGLCDVTCGSDCQNQRFQRKQYADIMVFKTKMKGYGVLANSELEPNDFIYEYIGEVIDESTFRDRIIKYDEMKFKHFYFMMLQSGQFIDATRKGCLARFCNHSCNPNAYVNKWIVNGKLKMGIFAKRKIMKGEEITFDYNVDRYGATAQKCYCGEANCIGFLGGKTQTDAASLLPQTFADALGINVSMEKKWIKERKAIGEEIVKGDDNINTDFVNSVDILPCEDVNDVTKVMSVLLQINNKFIAEKLFNRLFPIEENELLHQVIKLHGYKCFSNLIELFMDNEKIILKILKFLGRLPKTTKNGIVSSQLDIKIRLISEGRPLLKEQCISLLDKWNTYESYTRITKKDISEMSATNSFSKLADLRRIRLPAGWEIIQENGRPIYYNAHLQLKQKDPPVESKPKNTFIPKRPMKRFDSFSDNQERKRNKIMEEERKEREALERAKQQELKLLKAKLKQESDRRFELAKIIEEANRAKEAEREQSLKLEQEKQEKRQKHKSESHSARVEHKWNNYFATFVPNLVKKYQTDITMNHEHVKQCSRDIVKILSSKEIKKNPDITPPDVPTKEQRSKVKHFVNSYMEKFVAKYKAKKQQRKESSG